MKKIAQVLKNIWKDESGQGATEYILLLVIVVAIALLFRGQIQSMLEGKLGDLSSGLGGITTSF